MIRQLLLPLCLRALLIQKGAKHDSDGMDRAASLRALLIQKGAKQRGMAPDGNLRLRALLIQKGAKPRLNPSRAP